MLTREPAATASSIRSSPSEIRRLVQEFGSPLLIVDCERVRVQLRKLRKALPGVDLHYALKPLPHAAVVQTVIEEGAFLDLATTGEVQLVARLGIDPERCIHTHPIKRDQDIRNALEFGVRTFVADNPDEVRKFAPLRGQGGAAAARVVPQPRRGVRPVAQVRVRSGESAVRSRGWPRSWASKCAGCRSTWARRPRMPASTSKPSRPARSCSPPRARKSSASCDTLDIGGGFPIDYMQHGAGHRPLLRAHPRGARQAAEAGADHRGAGPVYRWAGGHRRRLRDGPRAARGPLVVLPGRRALRLLQRPALRSRALSGGAAAQSARSACLRCSPARPATASTSSRRT